MSNSSFHDAICANECRNTHHKLAMNALQHLKCPNADQWRSIFERHFEVYLEGSKAPDTKFKDFRNHVLHVSDNYWGGPVKQAEKWYALTVEHLKNEDWKSAVYAAGVLSHYYMDPLMPLHTGQTEEEGVIHRACEWSVNKSFGGLIEILEQGPGYPDIVIPTGSQWLKDAIHQAAEVAHAQYDSFIDHYNIELGAKDPPAGLDDLLRTETSKLLGHASVGFARILERAIAQANARPTNMSTGMMGVFYQLTRPISWGYKGLVHLLGKREVVRIAKEYQKVGKVVRSLPRDEKNVRQLHAQEILNVDLEQLDAKQIAPVGSKFVSRHRSAASENRSAAVATGRSSQTSPQRSNKRFRLELTDPVEAAPSIGKKTAARLEAVGVFTITDLLSSDPYELAHAIDTRHITAEAIEQWQRQTELACRIPMIYGHDAQILVGCGFESPEEIAESEPAMLLSLVDEFAKTEEAKFIIRGGQAPDRVEVENWIQWSKESRTLKAA